MTGQDCDLTIDELDAAIYALDFTFGDNALKPHDSPHNTRVEALRKLKAFRASLVVAVGAVLSGHANKQGHDQKASATADNYRPDVESNGRRR